MSDSDALPALRARLRERRRALPAAARIAGAEALATRLLALPFLPERGYVAGYWATDGEIGLHAFQLKLPAGLVYCLPVLHGEELRFAPWRAGDGLVTNRFGIPEPDVAPSSALEPEQMALVVMPLVGFDDTGHRLGMGGGWYDRSFAARTASAPPPWLVGVGFETQRTELPPPRAWDVRPDAICTESSMLILEPR
ncbi:5-formyltetrahydrofolate cyclo-ligase [Pseudoxanthomonas sp. X-1]|uniref:5-formyltetrahydrofolate cyclo-ligase n=1 Tax=Pseudoxanthomonas sp. X-1 TaxID=2571115 RepID=UPI00110A9907|nr:5-formyltetrahydrofolate cyclo-ligase [Pseudoxanthomonas sp. X-1]TMN16865.1 5-formyltetrahydrofolate cyclo-ligase [Pseudoxanthomonas sp. X-1]UAY75670.1 5-formyltetrahydrofolate cyclo-ligase [Pseudoxanthomonas sp. X-1]